jgi:NitT/TauT family transport system ATP-binding protein
MNQRVAIARTLIMHPKIILMDEPFGALDPATRHRMQDLLVKLWRELEATVFFITHDVPEAVYLGDRVYIFSPSPGTIVHQLHITPADRPARAMQEEPRFQESVRNVRALLEEVEVEKSRNEASK